MTKTNKKNERKKNKNKKNKTNEKIDRKGNPRKATQETIKEPG